MKTLKLADGLSLPLEVVTEKLAWLGRTGSGKTYGAMKAAELMLAAGAQVGAIDPVGVWRALRVAAEGGRSFDVVVFGGLYGDLPLEPTQAAGELVADLVCDRGLSFVLDVSQFIHAEQQRVVRAFADRLFQRRKARPVAMHLFLEECQEFIPENPSGDEARTLAVMQRLWKLGRNFGIGGSLISQRPQEIAKKALNMSGTLFAFQMTGPQERKAIRAWVADHGVSVDIEAVLQRLPVGSPHVESPTFLEVSRTVRILPRLTADVSSTPKVGGAGASPAQPLSPIDVQALKAAMAASLEQAKANDPAELKRALAETRAQLAQAQKAASVAAPVGFMLAETDRQALANFAKAAGDQMQAVAAAIEHAGRRLVEELVISVTAAAGEYLNQPGLRSLLERLDAELKRTAPARSEKDRLLVKAEGAYGVPAARPAFTLDEPTSSRRNRAAMGALQRDLAAVSAREVYDGVRGTSSDTAVAPARQRILNALLFFENMGLGRVSKVQLALLVGVPPTSGGYKNNLGALRAAGLIEYPQAAEVSLTGAGRAAASLTGIPTTTKELHAVLADRLGPARWRILEHLATIWPAVETKASLAARCGVPATSGGYKNNLGALRSLGLIDYPAPGMVAATDAVFLEK